MAGAAKLAPSATVKVNAAQRAEFEIPEITKPSPLDVRALEVPFVTEAMLFFPK